LDQLLLNLGPAPAPSFGNFWVGANGAALQAMQHLLNRQGKGFQSLVLWGEPGSGRSHLLQSLANVCGVERLTPTTLVQRFALPNSGTLAIFDDIDCYSPEQQQAAFVMWAELHANADQGTAVVASLSQAPATWWENGGRADLGSRLAQSLVFELKPLTDDQKAQALRTKFRERGLAVPDEVLDYLLTRLPRSMAALAAAVDELDKLGWQHKRAITLAMLRQWHQQGGLE
jgi:DnaA-homolog protein